MRPAPEKPPLTPGRLLYLARFYGSRGYRYWHAQRILAPRILEWRLPEGLEPAPDVPLHLLTSQHDWLMAIWMLASLHHQTGRKWRVFVHEDGSLPDETAGIFERLFPQATLIPREQADAAMADTLAGRPRCAEYRSRMPHGLKCFDVPCLADHDRFILVDPDVLFFANPDRMLEWVDNPGDDSCWFNADYQEPSPLAPEDARAAFDFDLWPKVNSGLCLLSKDAIDLDAMEKWLDHPALRNLENGWRVEQTLLALSASRHGRGGLLPEDEYEVSRGSSRRPRGVTRHYIGQVRSRFHSEGIRELAPILLP